MTRSGLQLLVPSEEGKHYVTEIHVHLVRVSALTPTADTCGITTIAAIPALTAVVPLSMINTSLSRLTAG